MKKRLNIFIPVLLVLVFAIFITSHMVMELYAKYMSSSDAQDEARVAEFNVDISGTTLSDTEHLTIKGLKPGDTIDHKIKITVSSEVAFKYTISIVTTDNLPLEFSIDSSVLNHDSNELVYEEEVTYTNGEKVIIKTLNISYVTDDASDNYMESYEIDMIDIIVTVEQID